MSTNSPITARLCTQCGYRWYSQQAQDPSCVSCGSGAVQTVSGTGFVPTAVQNGPAGQPPNINVNVNVNTAFPAPAWPVGNAFPAGAPSFVTGPAGSAHWAPPHTMAAVAPPSPKWWRSPRFWFFALPFATGGLASWVPPLWVASKVHEGQLRARLYITAAVTAVLALIGFVLVGSAPADAMGSATGPRADVGTGILIIAIGIGMGTAILHRQRVFPDGSTTGEVPVDGPAPLPGVQEAQARRQRRADYRSLAAGDPALARELNLGRPDRTPAFDDGGLVDLNALDAAALERHAGVTRAEAATIVNTRERLGGLSSVDELVVHGDLTLATAERLRDHAVFIG